MHRRRAGSIVGVLLATATLAAAPLHGKAQSGAPASPGPLERAQPGHESRAFVNEMAIAGMAEVQLGKLAAARGSHAEVKAFGQQMVTDHSKANEELKQAASPLGVTPPTELDQKHKDLAAKLSKLSGAEFDREYMSAMVQGHQDVASKLRTRINQRPATDRASGSGTNGASGSGAADSQGEQRLTQWAAKTLPTVEQHLQRARELQQKVAQ